MPVRELLDLRLCGVVIEDAGAVIERLSGTLPLDGLNPSALIFTYGFRVKASQQIVRRLVSMLVAFTALCICLPFIPFIMLAVRLSSPGPIFFGQIRVGLRDVRLRGGKIGNRVRGIDFDQRSVLLDMLAAFDADRDDCAGALGAARVSRVVFAAPDPKAGACGALYNLCGDPRLNHELAVTQGVLRQEASALLSAWFAARRL